MDGVDGGGAGKWTRCECVFFVHVRSLQGYVPAGKRMQCTFCMLITRNCVTVNGNYIV